jgi:hypothetical protein
MQGTTSGAGSSITDGSDTTDGPSALLTSGVANPALSEFQTVNGGQFSNIFKAGMTLAFKFKLTATTKAGLRIGLTNVGGSNPAINVNDPLGANTQTGVILFVRQANSGNFFIHCNNGGATATKTDTGVAIDTNSHTVVFRYDGSFLHVNIDNSYFVSLNGTLPAANSKLLPEFQTICEDGATATTCKAYFMAGEDGV